MSNYHYYEGNSVGCYAGKWSSDYATDYGQKTNDQCLPYCMDRFENERSNRDQMDYQFYVLHEKPHPRPEQAKSYWPRCTLPGQAENYRRN